jgi:WD40 repeat protein
MSHAMTASADERLLATVGIASRVSKTNAVVRVWRAGGPGREGRGTLVEYTGHERASATACAFINTAFDAQGDVSRMASCDDKGSVQLWKCCTGERAWQFRDNASGGFSCLSVVDETSVVIAGGAHASVVMADINAGRVARTFACPRMASPFGHGVSAVSSGGGDANVLYASNRDGYVCAFDARTSGERPIFDVKAHDGQISKIIAPTSGASRAFITASADMTVALWDSRMIAATVDSKTRYDGRVRTFRGHRSAVQDVALGPNDDVVFSVAGSSVGVCSLAAASADAAEESRVVTFTPLNIETDDERAVLAPPPRGTEHHLAAPSSELCALTVLPASRLFAVLSDDGVLRICN